MPTSKAKKVELRNNRWVQVEKFWMKVWPRWEEYSIQANAGVYWKWYSDAAPFFLEGKFTRNDVRLFIPGGVHCQVFMRSVMNSTVVVR